MNKQRIYLGPIRPEDESSMLDILTSKVVNRTYMLPDFNNREDAIPLFHGLTTLSNDANRYVRGIYKDTQLIGFMNDVEIENRVIELGYVIHPDFHGRGYMTQALTIAITELFTGGYTEVITGAFDHNIASIRVMEKAGMAKLDKTDMIEYRGNVHRCVYYHAVRN